jgi:hypothetical protein
LMSHCCYLLAQTVIEIPPHICSQYILREGCSCASFEAAAQRAGTIAMALKVRSAAKAKHKDWTEPMKQEDQLVVVSVACPSAASCVSGTGLVNPIQPLYQIPDEKSRFGGLGIDPQPPVSTSPPISPGHTSIILICWEPN